jgi:hypothetical protein
MTFRAVTTGYPTSWLEACDRNEGRIARARLKAQPWLKVLAGCVSLALGVCILCGYYSLAGSLVGLALLMRVSKYCYRGLVRNEGVLASPRNSPPA